MPRILHTGLFPSFPEHIPADALVITFQRDTAAKFGVPNYSLNRLASAAIRQRGLSIASAKFARHTLKSVIAEEYPGTDPASLATRLKNTLEIVLRTGIDPDQLIAHGSPRVAQLGRVAAAYRGVLRKTGHIDRSELLWEAARAEPEQRRLMIFGHFRARKEEILFINAVAGDGSEYFLPVSGDGIFTSNREWAEFLDENGWTLESRIYSTPSTSGASAATHFINSDSSPSVIEALAYPDIEAEIRGVLSQVKDMVSGGADPGEIAIIVRDKDQYVRPIATVAEEYGLPIRSAYSTPLAATSLGGFVRLMLDAIETGFRFESTARFLMHPYGPGITADAFSSARKLHISGFEKWEGICPELHAVHWTEAHKFQTWVDLLRDAFELYRVREKAGMLAREAVAYNTFFDAIYGSEPLQSRREMSFAAFAAIIAEILSDESVPFIPGNGGVAILTPDEMVGRSYEHVFVLGLAEGIYPRSAVEDPVVDFYERRKLAKAGVLFAGAAEVARWEDLSFFFTLTAARTGLHLSLPKMTNSGEAFPSSYLHRIGIEHPTDAPSAGIDSSIEEQRTTHLRHDVNTADDVIDRARRQHFVETDRESSSPYGEYDGVIGVRHDAADRTWSASQLTTIGQCSFKWFAQRILRLKPLEEMEYGLDPATRGLLYHKTLEIAVAKAKDEPDIRAAVLDCLDTAFAEAEKDESVGLPVLPNWEQERLEQLRELRKAVAAPDFIFEGSRVVGIEQEFKDTWQGFPLIGYIDRVDDTPDGLIAIDYKTSGSVPKGAKDQNGKLTVDVQIPLYANVALRKLYPDGNFGNSVYYSLTKGKILRENKPDDMVKLENLAEEIKAILAAGSFAIDPDDAGNACTYCEYGSICRKGPRLRRKARA